MKFKPLFRFTCLALLATSACAARAADWSDTSLSYRYGTQFAEPFIKSDISKQIINFTNVSGYKYGKNFFSIDFRQSDDKDPSSAGSHDGAVETYAVYRNTLDLGAVTGTRLGFGPVRSIGITGGFDINDKTDAGYNSKKRMLVLGPTLMFDVPGFLDLSLDALRESNAPYSSYTHVSTNRYTYKTHPMLTASWGIPFSLGSVPLSFEGHADYIGAKGENEFGHQTAVEINVDMQVMYDLSPSIRAAKNTLKLGVEYQYWKNKFGNPSDTVLGATARTPMVRAEYHF